MKMPMSEILDRYTITQIRSERTDSDTAEEMLLYEKETALLPPEMISDFIDRLYQANLDLWVVEEEIYKIINKSSPDYTEIGHLAMQVRDLNWTRNRVKEEISDSLDKISLNYSKVKYGRA
jgi:hypothetical protein